MKRRRIWLMCWVAALSSAWTAPAAFADPLTLPAEKRPEWLQREGIVMAGSWEPLLFAPACRRERLHADRATGAGYQREHSPEMIASLKALGVNFVMMHCFKGAGLQAERESMADAARFAKLCRANGLHVGAYVRTAGPCSGNSCSRKIRPPAIG